MLYLTVHLYGRNGVPGEFRDYELKALTIFRKHGGDIVVAYTPTADPTRAETPEEIQVLRIASRAALDAFMHDPERLALATEREAVIRKTEVFLSDELVSYEVSP
jgi:uncharacterized protein (DUF1330 family)